MVDENHSLISYSHVATDGSSQRDRVREFADRLRSHGIDAHIDQYEEIPPANWAGWMYKQIQDSRFVLVVCTQPYYERVVDTEGEGSGTGAGWEGAIITNELYQEQKQRGSKFIPVVFASTDRDWVPYFLKQTTVYTVTDEKDYELLLRHLHGQPPVLKPPLGRPPWESAAGATPESPAGRAAPQPRLQSRSLAVSTMWPGHLELFVADEAGAIHHRWRNADNDPWAPWHAMPAPPGHEVAALAAGSGERDRQSLFAVTADGSLWRRGITEVGWGEWARDDDINAVIRDAAVSSLWPGHFEVFAVDNDGMLHHRYRDAVDGPWVPWQMMPRPGDQPVRAVAAGSPQIERRQDLYAIVETSAIWRRAHHEQSGWGGWSHEEPAARELQDAAVSSMWPGHFEVFVVDGAGLIRHRWRNADDEHWSPWNDMPTPNGQPVSAVAAASPERDRQDLFAVSADGSVWRRPCAPKGWDDWHAFREV